MSSRARYLLIAFFLVTAAICARLGLWQYDRLGERRAANAVAASARSAPPVDLAAGWTDRPADLREHRVVATGRYDHAREIVVRGQAYRGSPGIHVYTPLRLAGRDTAILVNRGFVPAPDALSAVLDSLRPDGEVRVEGLALPLPTLADSGQPVTGRRGTSWRRPDLAALRGRLPYPILDVYVLALPISADARGFPRRLAAPPLDDGPHLNYAIQWFAFGGIALVFGGIFATRRSGPEGR